MNNMPWPLIIQLIGQYGLPLAELLWKKWGSTDLPTQADWDQLKALAAQNAKAQMMAALIRNGVDPNSAQGQALLALVS